MKKNRFTRAELGLVLLLAFGGLACPGAESESAPLNILLLCSGDYFTPGGMAQDRAMRETINAGSGRTITYFLETLHANTISATGFDGEFAKFTRQKYAGHKIDLIITGGTAALNFVDRNRAEFWPEAPVVFTSVGEATARDRKFAPGITGVTMKFDLGATLDLAVRLQPGAPQIVVVTGASEADHYWLPIIQDHLRAHHSGLPVTYLTNHTMPQLEKELGGLRRDNIVFYPGLVADAAGRRYVPRDAAEKLAAASGAPMYGVYETLLDHGVVGGMVASFAEHGRQAGEEALRVLAGGKAGVGPVTMSTASAPVVDWRLLQKWGISEDRLPPGTTVLFKPPSLWSQHKWLIIGALAVMVGQTVTIAGLVAQRGRRKRAEMSARENEARMKLAAESARLGIWARDVKQDNIWATERWRQLFGFLPDEAITFQKFLGRLHPEDRERVRGIVQRALEQRSGYELEHRIVLPDNSVRWIASRGAAMSRNGNGNGAPERTLGASMDITARRQADEEMRQLSGRLIHAQEEERRRIARELHDDLNQRLALLSVDLELLGQEGMNGHANSRIGQISAQVRELSSDVHKLAYQLHPAKLDQLGLVAAAGSCCRELAQQSGVKIEFTHENVPRNLPAEIALCLFRILQEALHNMVKHSGAKDARVKLVARTEEIRLEVSDDGKGFEVEHARRNGGLGMLSMQERLRLVHGEIAVHSRPGQGTRVELSVPLVTKEVAV